MPQDQQVVQLNIRVPLQTHINFKVLAARRRTPLAELVVVAMRDYTERADAAEPSENPPVEPGPAPPAEEERSA